MQPVATNATIPWSVCLSVCWTTVSHAQTAEPIKIVWLWTWVGPRNHLLGGGPDPPREKGNLGRTCLASL